MSLVQKMLIIATALIAVSSVGLRDYFEKTKTLEATISLNDLETRNVELEPREFPYVAFTGEVKNNSSNTINSLFFRIRIYDCPTEIVGPDCEIIGEEVANPYVRIPAGQVRRFFDLVAFKGMPLPKNKVKWTYEIVNVKAEKF